MFGLNTTWQLDPRLKADTFIIREDDDALILLMNDKRWPWVILVPKIAGAEELHDISPGRRGIIMDRAIDLGEKLKSETGCEKINIAAIGNIVRQLHIHVVARQDGDPNWPNPVWGFGQKEQYSGAEGMARAAQLKDVFRVSLFS